MIRHTKRVVAAVLRALAYGFVGGFSVLLVVFVIHLDSRTDLKLWHEVELEEDFVRGRGVRTLDDYRALEDRLFAELEEKVVAQLDDEDRRLFNRFHPGSRSDPGAWSTNWNRTFELVAPEPKAGVLLIHGMSDAPYSLRTFGERLHARGAHVLGLRMPGHGTAPSGLVGVRWRDMVAATTLGVRHLKEAVGDRPLFVIGYSTGGALGVLYALNSLEDADLPRLDGLMLVSPAIGVARVAALAVWQARLGDVLGHPKLAWTSILPEYDPFKYNSFAVNAGDQVFRMTTEIAAGLAVDPQELAEFPPVLAFQSVVDATVSTPALVEVLLDRLPEGRHELVLFDVNQNEEIRRLQATNPRDVIAEEARDATRPYTLSLVTNAGTGGDDVVLRRHAPGSRTPEEIPLGLEWPRAVYSLSHVALPFAPDDPLYGRERLADFHVWLGGLALFGERGALQIPAGDRLRQRWNPFFPYVMGRMEAFVGVGPAGRKP